MNSTAYEQFFIHPTDPWHRRYEALRALFVDQQSLQEVAQRFGVSYRTVCNWANEFRRQCDADQRPPFSFNHHEAAHREAAQLDR